MAKTADPPHDKGLAADHHSPKPEEIRCQLGIVLESPAFHGSKRCQRFLEYVCLKSLAGETGALKERTVAIEVFGRQPQSDLAEDTIVRVGAREVRKRLAQYYVTPQGETAHIRIDLPSGAYAPDFRYANARKVNAAAVIAPRVESKPPRRWRRWAALAAGCATLASLAAIVVARRTPVSPNELAFRQFWDPVFRSPDPLLLAVAHPIVYHASLRALKMSEARLPPQAVEAQRPIQLPPNELNGSDMVPVFNQYVGFGDLVTATEVSAMLARNSKNVRVRMASGIEFADLRQAQTLLIGAVTNRWTMELQQSWRFQFGRTPELKSEITDTMGPRDGSTGIRRHWSIPARDDGSAPEDYMLLCRIHSSVTGSLVIVAAGLKQFGPEAAGRLLTDSDQFGGILRKLPTGWDSKNLQIVLHAKVIGNAAAQPEVVAWHLWPSQGNSVAAQPRSSPRGPETR